MLAFELIMNITFIIIIIRIIRAFESIHFNYKAYKKSNENK